MRCMDREQFRLKWSDTHTELRASELSCYDNTGTLVKDSPGDKGITKNHEIKGKRELEARGFEKRAENLRDMVLDAVDVRRDELLDMPMRHLLKSAIDLVPKKMEAKHEHNFTFASMVARAVEEPIDVDYEESSESSE